MTRQELIDQWLNQPESLHLDVTGRYPDVRPNHSFITSSVVDLAEDGTLIFDGDNMQD